jgi:hypothetical protein
MKIIKIIFSLLFIYTPVNCLQSKVASVKIYSALVDYESLFKDDDISLISYNLLDSGILSNQVKVSGSMSVQGVYTTFTGQFDSPFTTVDNNRNGIYDFLEVEQDFNLNLTGTATYNFQNVGSYTANLFARFTRVTGQHTFNLNETVTVQTSNIPSVYPGQTEYVSETLNAVHALGTITYDENAGTYTYYLGYHGTSSSASGSGTYSVNSDSSITLSEMSFPSIGDSSFASSFPALSKKTLSSSLTVPFVSGNKFHVMTQIENAPFYLVIEDDNDANSDGKPDLLRTTSQEVQSLNLSGWNYHIWPWVYNSSDDNWLYYHRSGDDWLVWRNKTSTWLKFDASNGLWVSN